MILLVGLGNPGSKYVGNRHNIGYMVVDEIARAHGFESERVRFQGLTREGFLNGPGGRQKALILKPTTYMNESGRAVSEACRFYKIEPEDVIVFHDELDLAEGKVRAKAGGGLAGHNGLKSIRDHIGPYFRRVRIGIAHPGDKNRVSGHVLSDFSKADQAWLEPLIRAIADASPLLLDEDDAKFMTKVALATQPQREKNPKPKETPEDGI
ncbi:MAG: aminoacyl-tRNA hydrolase [Alphaproteobacteria bacterium]|nr:MAG: aminoacyl-tRNA hydrolase [Alphaproteobacteria bacterium]